LRDDANIGVTAGRCRACHVPFIGVRKTGVNPSAARSVCTSPSDDERRLLDELSDLGQPESVMAN